MRPLLQLASLRKAYGALVVTDGIDLSVAAGEAVGVIGPNGAGKSTLFNLISGDVRPDAGRILLDGADIGALPPHARARLGIGRSYQIPLPFTRMSVYENLLVGARYAGRDRVAHPARHCAEVLAQTGLAPQADRPAGRLTLLDRKRLELARALATRPRLLLLDEIAGGLTDAESHALVETIAAVRAASEVAIIWVEHVLHALLPAIGRLVVLNFGRKMAEGEPHAIMRDEAVRAIYLGIDDDAPAAA